MPVTLQEALEQAEWRPSGFDYMRIFLAVGVVASHTVAVAKGSDASVALYYSAFRPLLKLLVPAFFALSGFLVAGSMQRSKTLLTFLGLRVLRIYPALCVEVLLSALLIGPIVTNLPLRQYFTDPLFARYLLNATGDVSYALPGVFLANPQSGIVNSQLWTVPWELSCYILLAGLILFGARRHRIVPLAGFCLLTMAFGRGFVLGKYGVHYGHVPGLYLTVYFLAGIAIYLYRDLLPASRRLALPCLAGTIYLLGWVPGGDLFAAAPLAYCVAVLGSMNPRRLSLLRHADISYGIYLYGYAIQQFVVWALPWALTWYWNLLLALPFSVIAGLASWHAVERPAQKLRPCLTTLEGWWLGLRTKPATA